MDWVCVYILLALLCGGYLMKADEDLHKIVILNLLGAVSTVCGPLV